MKTDTHSRAALGLAISGPYSRRNRRRIHREDIALWGFVALACLVPAIAAAMFIIL